jgi:general secretion pathway protein G
MKKAQPSAAAATRATRISNGQCRATRAFTLMEVIIVVALIGTLMVVLVPRFTDLLSGAQEDVEKIKIEGTLGGALNNYRVRMGSYPSTEEGLQALLVAPANAGDKWRGPYVEDASTLIDTWGLPYQYQNPGTRNSRGARGYDLWSSGPDRTNNEGAGDDITSWKKAVQAQ